MLINLWLNINYLFIKGTSNSAAPSAAPSPPPVDIIKKEESIKVEMVPQELPPPSLESMGSGAGMGSNLGSSFGSAPPSVYNVAPINNQQRREPPTESQKLNALRQQQQRFIRFDNNMIHIILLIFFSSLF